MKIKKYLLVSLVVLIALALVAMATSGKWFSGNLFGISKNGLNQPRIESIKHEFNINRQEIENLPDFEIDEQTRIKSYLEAANIVVMEIEREDPDRHSGGNVNMNGVIDRFYSRYPDDFDTLIVIDFEPDLQNNIQNGCSNGSIGRYLPSNLGKINHCSSLVDPYCSNVPSRLRHMQQVTYHDHYRHAVLSYMVNVYVHEILHYWGVGWHTSTQDECFEPWVSQMLENGHWTERFQAGNFSTHTYPTNFKEARENPPTAVESDIPRGNWTDNYDGTFTKEVKQSGDSQFNYMDLYQMGILSEAELSTKEMYVVLDPVLISTTQGADGAEEIYSGTRRDVTLDDFKNLLLQREVCENTGLNYYYTGNGSRVPMLTYESAIGFQTAFILIKYPDQIIENQEARLLCKIINEELPAQWYKASEGNSQRSTIRTYLSDNTINPDCEGLFPEEKDAKLIAPMMNPDFEIQFLESDTDNHNKESNYSRTVEL